MRPLPSTMTEVDTLPGEEVEFGIADARWVMRSLADLYSNRELAIIREYSTNARDAQVMAGRADEAIKVTLPSVTHPYFSVEDTGVGMSEDTLKNRYTQFGDSDKRDTNDANGMLGFGCKSAIAYTSQFTVTSVKDGRKTIAVISKRPDYSIVLKVVATSLTSERNGTRVEIPVHDVQKFNYIAADFYKFWEAGTVEVNGSFPVQAVGDKIDEGLYYSTTSGTSYVVMGNVAYRIANPDALFRGKGINPISFVAYVPNGSVEFTPSREDLKYSDHTVKTLHSVIDKFVAKIVQQANKELDAAKDHFEAYCIYRNWTDRLGEGIFKDFKWDGEAFKDEFAIAGVRYRYGESSGYGTRRIDRWRVSNMRSTLIITDFPHMGSLTAGHKAKARRYTNEVSGAPSATTYLFTAETDVKSVWIDKKRIVKWDDLVAALPKKVRVGGTSGRPARIKGTFDYFTYGGFETEKALPEDKDIYYITSSARKEIAVNTALLNLGWKDAVVVILAANRIAKFTRDNPGVKSFLDEAVKKVVLDGTTLLTADAREALGISYAVIQWVTALPVDKIADPEFARTKALYERKDSLLTEYHTNLALANSLAMGYNVKKHMVQSNNSNLLSKYPLLPHLSTYNRSTHSEIVLYINAAYEQRKGN